MAPAGKPKARAIGGVRRLTSVASLSSARKRCNRSRNGTSKKTSHAVNHDDVELCCQGGRSPRHSENRPAQSHLCHRPFQRGGCFAIGSRKKPPLFAALSPMSCGMVKGAHDPGRKDETSFDHASHWGSRQELQRLIQSESDDVLGSEANRCLANVSINASPIQSL